MTTALFATHPLAFGHELHLELGRTRAVVVALLAALCFALVAPSAMQFDRLEAVTAPKPGDSKRAAPADAPAAQPTARPAVREARKEIDALATLVARRYRISSEATRGLVAAAYGEGSRIGLDPLLIVAVIAVESSFNPIAESGAGAQGLMQVIPEYHKDQFEAAGVDSVLDPHDNIRLGAHILKQYIQRGGTEVAGLQLYNGSSSDSTNAYAVKVLAEKQRLLQAIRNLRDRARA